MMKPVKDNMEITGLESTRQLKQYALWKPVRFGWIAEGPGWSRLLELWVRHKFGYVIAYLTLRYEPQWHRLLNLGRRIRRRLLRC